MTAPSRKILFVDDEESQRKLMRKPVKIEVLKCAIQGAFEKIDQKPNSS